MNRQNLLVNRVAYPGQSFDAALAAPSNKQLLITSINAVNGSPAKNDLGIGYTVNSTQWKLYTSQVAVVDVTSTIQSGAVVDLFTTTNGEGFIIQAKDVFGMLAFNLSQAQTGSPVYTYEYWDGSSWQPLQLLASPDYATLGHTQVVFEIPLDWAIGDAGIPQLDDQLYSMRILATTAPATAVQADSMKMAVLLAYREALLSKAELEVNFDTRQFLLQQGEEIIGFFAVADSKNVMEVTYQLNP